MSMKVDIKGPGAEVPY